MAQRTALLNIVGLTPSLLCDATPTLVEFARKPLRANIDETLPYAPDTGKYRAHTSSASPTEIPPHFGE